MSQGRITVAQPRAQSIAGPGGTPLGSRAPDPAAFGELQGGIVRSIRGRHSEAH